MQWVKTMENYTVTISRQFGSLGRPIAVKLAEILNIEYYDRDIVEETSKKLGLPISVISKAEEAAKTSFFSMSYPLGMDTTEVQDRIFKEQAKIIRNLADTHTCIIVGRCSDYILANDKNSMHIFIHAPYEARLRNCVDYLRMDVDTAKKMILKVDKARDKYHKNYTGYLPNDIKHTNICVDSSMLGVDGTARVLVEIVKERFNLEER